MWVFMLPVLLTIAYRTVLEKTTLEFRKEFRKKLKGWHLCYLSGSKYFNLDRNFKSYDKICEFFSNKKSNSTFIKIGITRDLEYSKDFLSQLKYTMYRFRKNSLTYKITQWIVGLSVIASLSLGGKDLDQIFRFLDPNGPINSTTLKGMAIIILGYNCLNLALNLVVSLYRLLCLIDINNDLVISHRLIWSINLNKNNLLVEYMSKSEKKFFFLDGFYIGLLK